MSCQCYQIGGPFIAEDPDCVVHGYAAQSRERQADRLRERARQPGITMQELQEIIDEFHTLAVDLF